MFATLSLAAYLGSTLTFPDGRVLDVDVSCDPASVIVLEDIAYAACDAEGVLAVDVKEAPRVLGLHRLEGRVSGLHVSGGRVWAEVTRVEAYPLERTLALAPAPSEVPTQPRETAAADVAAPATPSRFFPPRQGGVGSVALTARPLLPLGTIGAGVIAHASTSYHFERPIEVGLVVEPLAGALTNDRNVGSVGVTGFVAYDHAYFALGLGLGVTSLSEVVFDGDGLPTSQDRALLIAQLARIGALDGLHLVVRNSFAVIEDEFDYNGTVVRLQVPVSDSISVFGGGGGAQGFAFGELGVRFRALGSGAADTLFVDLSAGGGRVDGTIDVDDCGLGVPCRSTDSYGGPLVGVGLEYRL